MGDLEKINVLTEIFDTIDYSVENLVRFVDLNLTVVCTYKHMNFVVKSVHE